jgi:hypothetical protein
MKMCEKCKPFNGLRKIKDTGGVERCECPSGIALKQADEARKNQVTHPPVLSHDSAMAIVEMLSGHLDYFPPIGSGIARGAIAGEIRNMCHDQDQGIWLANRMAKLYSSWPGTREMRIVYCSKFRPLDGVEISGASDFFPEGIPSEAETAGALPAPEMKYLTAGRGEPVSDAESLNNVIYALATAKDMKNAGKKLPVPDLPVLPPGERISQADIDAAVEANRDRAAREELGL